MKKLTALLVTLIGVLVFALSGCSSGDVFTAKSYTGGESEITKVTVRVEDRELEISASENDRVYIDYFDGEKEYLDISVSDNGELTVEMAYEKDWTDFIGAKPSAEYRKIKIRLPDNLIKSLSASTTNEDIKITALTVTESVTLESNGGSIQCERVGVGNGISLNAKNGDITGSVIGGWDDFAITCKIKKGECNLPLNKDGGEKSFSAECNNGNIDIRFVK